MIRLRLETRPRTPAWLNFALPFGAVLATLLICSGLIVLADADVWRAYRALFGGAFGSRFNAVETVVKAAPLVFTGLAVAVAFRAKFWNIGAEGQLLAGAMAAAFIGAREALPVWSLVPLMILAGALAGAAWAGLPAVLKVRYRVDDVVATLMLNFVIFYAMMALVDGPWKDPLSGYPDSPDIRMDAEYPILLAATRLHLGVLLAAVAAVAVWLLMTRTTLGFAIRAVGENPRAAAHGGIFVNRVVLGTALISGALAGLAGVGEVAGLHFQVMASLSPGYGYTGIVIAMLARLNPLGVVPAALFFAAVATGAETMSRQTGVPVFLADVIQGTSLLCMLVALLFTTYRIRMQRTAVT
ncbi:MAG: ABC transporter permease [Gammaproteobacteria bacterium]|nr:ABC transporter permease [Gammaproteobacteria bacterium]NIR85752.1 ABC transporter permease [Gammaproteobacteria bacterium]NIR90285.1 ABC transporter permease [Gammaproteobacteria bacterium]NIU06886.1 ABC transporter permease [Gammaproteobacteria bacterium]NIV53819.1 ABC transporter permease [Gammaproteobacteria bacterium]